MTYVCLLHHNPRLIYAVSRPIVHVSPTGCWPVLLPLQFLSLPYSDTDSDTLGEGPTSRSTYLPQFCEVDLESLGVLVKPKSDHGVKNVLATDGFAFLNKAFLCSFACDEAYEL